MDSGAETPKAKSRYTGVPMRVHPKLKAYLLARQESDSERLGRHVSLSELTETVAGELFSRYNLPTVQPEATGNE